MLAADLRHDYVSVVYMLLEEGHADFELINSRLKEMKERATSTLKAEKIPQERMRFTYQCDARYEAQVHEITISLPLSPEETFNIKELPLLKQTFDHQHDSLFGYSLPDLPRELLCLRLVAEGITQKPSFRETPFMGEDTSHAIKGKRQIYYGGEFIMAPIYDGSKMGHGNKVFGPAIVEEPTTTMLITPDYDLTCDKYSNYLIYPKGMSLEESLSKLRR
jgi:N-methylhydantoinase A